MSSHQQRRIPSSGWRWACSLPSKLALRTVRWGVAAALVGMALVPAARALTFSFTCQGDLSCSSFNAGVLNGFNQAASRWRNRLFDNIAINLRIDYRDLGLVAANQIILGGATPTTGYLPYSTLRTLLALDAKSAADATAVSFLPTSASLPLLLNYTSNHPNVSGSATAYLDNDGDANNAFIDIASANAKALGLGVTYDPTAPWDALIEFTNRVSWDFDPADGITAGQLDFVGVATHEIGHALGFLSGVDVLDTNSPSTSPSTACPSYCQDNQFSFVTPFDLFRRSDASRAASASLGQTVIDWTAGTTAKYFAIDGGSSTAFLSTGLIHGDGRQAGHWKDGDLSGVTLGIMDPTASAGQLGVISSLDLLAFDVIGYDTSAPVPAPLPLLGAGSAMVWSRRLRRRISR